MKGPPVVAQKLICGDAFWTTLKMAVVNVREKQPSFKVFHVKQRQTKRANKNCRFNFKNANRLQPVDRWVQSVDTVLPYVRKGQKQGQRHPAGNVVSHLGQLLVPFGDTTKGSFTELCAWACSFWSVGETWWTWCHWWIICWQGRRTLGVAWQGL